ncbi:hypothetical protein OAB57_00160 [Bacteriovoracaceae bacterium]|nr:hypothetical protein [Bacteriovoracaceae bacterium]
MTDSPLSSLINSDDFNEIVYSFLLVNNTSGTKILDPSIIQIVSVTSTGLELRLPLASCNQGHKITIYIFKEKIFDKKVPIPLMGKHKKLKRIEVMGKVLQITALPDKTQMIGLIELTQFEQKEWDQFLENFTVRQDAILDLIVKSQS